MADKKAKVTEKEEAPKPEAAEGEAVEGAENAEGAEGEGGGRFSGKKKLIAIAGGVVFLLILAVSGAYFTGALNSLLPGHQPDCAAVKEGEKDYEACVKLQEEAVAAKGPAAFIDMPDLIVNLNSSTTKQPHFLKIALKIELENKEDEVKFTEVLPRVVDQFQTYLRELRMEDLRGSSGLYRMKIELLTRVRAAAPGVKVRDVLFQEILVQ